MNKKIACIFPGQGSQYVGMGQDFIQAFPTFRQTLEVADEKLGFSLSKLMLEGPEEELIQTKNSQVAIYVLSVALYRVFQEQFPTLIPSVTGGLSLGEYTALTASGRLPFEEGVALVRARGLYMNEASLARPGTMAVCLGLDVPVVEQVAHLLEGVWVANLNCPGQVVISGTHEGVRDASVILKEKGAKGIIPLDVSGAFHSGLMEPAKVKLKKEIESLKLHSSTVDLTMNVPGDYVESEDDIKRHLIDQVVSPVLWEKSIRMMESRGTDLYIEIGCGKTLRGMNRKIGVKGPTLSLEKVGDLEGLGKSLEQLKSV